MAIAKLKFENLQRVLSEYGSRVKELYVDELERRGKIASGDLQRSVKHHVTIGDKTISVELSLEEYWTYVEDGRKPGRFPPVDKILEWVKIKPVIPRPNSKGKIPTPNQLAFLISRKIANEGMPPTHILRDTLATANREFERMIIEAMEKDVTLLFTAEIEQFYT